MTPEEQAALDQAVAEVVDMYCPMWRRMYGKLQSEGFTTTESFKLLQTYILSQCPNGIRGDDA